MRLTFAWAATLFVAMASPALPQEKQITLGTGGQTGIYFALGQSICALVNKQTEENKLKCAAPATAGSVANINAVMAGEATMGIAKSEWVYHAYNGSPQMNGVKFDKLRSVFSVHDEPFTVVARAGAGIAGFDDLKGRRVSIGAPGTSQRSSLDALLGVKGWKLEDFSLVTELKTADQAAALCDNKVDAVIYTVGNPNGSIEEATEKCSAVIVPVAGADIDRLVADYPYYTRSVIPAGLYDGADNDIPTFGARAVLVASADTDEATVYRVVKAVFDNFDHFKELHPAFAGLKPEEMARANFGAPLHPGAARYFREKSWF